MTLAAVSGLGDPGANGIVKRTALNTAVPAVAGTDYYAPGGAVAIGDVPPIPESKLSISDNTTGNVSIAAHGLAPKAPNDATKYLNGVGAYAAPADPTSLVRAHVTNSTGTSIPASTPTAITFDTEVVNVGASHSTSVNSSRLTVPAGGAGTYLIHAQLAWPINASASQTYAFIRKNGTTTITEHLRLLSGSVMTTLPLAVWLDLADGDYIEVIGYQNTSGSWGFDQTNTFLQWVKLR
jgi:hypothetical protein